MIFIIVIWGCHFIVMKSGLSDIPPLTYNALRYAIAMPFITGMILYRDRTAIRISRGDIVQLLVVFTIGSTVYQIFFALALNLTTSTNTALVVATMPAWTAIISIFAGMVALRRRMLIGVGITLVGVIIVVLGGSGAHFGLSHNDLIGSLLALAGAIVTAWGNIATKPLVDRLGGIRVSLWSYWITTGGLIVIALPDLIHLSPDRVPPRVWPNIFYSGFLSGILGTLIWNYALKALGPTRAVSYQNFPPIVAAVAGIIFLGDPLTLGLVVGGTLTLAGVVMVRKNTFLKPARAGQEWSLMPFRWGRGKTSGRHLPS
jgi:drug/metabolite transporter (DMT)-like permease